MRSDQFIKDIPLKKMEVRFLSQRTELALNASVKRKA